MKTPRRSLLLVLPVVSLLLAACGGPPKGDVAVIKTGSGSKFYVSDAQYKRFFNETLVNQEQKPLAQITPLIPPNFTACVTAAQKAIPADSQRKTSVAASKKTCQSQYDTVRNNALQQAITLNWLVGEAQDRGIKFRKAEVQLALDTTITQQFQGQAGYKTFLKQTGFQQPDVDLNIIAKLAETKITAAVQAESSKAPTDAEVLRYFEQKKSTYVQPETRDLRLIKAKDLADANAALAAIKAGGSWKDIAAKYSTDAATKATGGSVVATTADQQPPQFASTVFKAKAGALLGPIKSTLAYYVVKVQAVHPEKQPVYKDLKAQLSQALQSQNQQTAFDNFKTLFFARWATRTQCASGYNDLVACGGDNNGGTTPTTPQSPAPPGAGLPKYAPSKPVDPTAALNAAGSAASSAASGAQTQTTQTP